MIRIGNRGRGSGRRRSRVGPRLWGCDSLAGRQLRRWWRGEFFEGEESHDEGCGRGVELHFGGGKGVFDGALLELG